MFFWIIVFFILFLTNRNRYMNVFLLAILLFSIVNGFLNKTFFAPYQNIEVANFMNTVFVLGVFPTLMLALSVATFFNSKVLMEKEGFKIRNLFISLIGIGGLIVLGLTIYNFGFASYDTNVLFAYIYVFGIYFYFLGLYAAKALYTALYIWIKPLYEPDFIIVLGSGLIGGDRVPPLLASRLDRAVRQFKKYGKRPLLITSGGQGTDEKVAEAFAMKKYLMDTHGLKDHEVIMEDRSTTTYENMLFSKRIIDALKPNAKGNFVTNNFHVFRAGIYANKIGLNAIGLGSKTAWYYVPNAFMREFIALLEMFKWRHIFILSMFTVVVGFLYLMQVILN